MGQYDNWGDPPADNEGNKQTGKKGKGMNTENIISFRKNIQRQKKLHWIQRLKESENGWISMKRDTAALC